ncbi:MAG TPA: class I tRNA ligase family protein [Candidatus Binatia bacterium]|nr:class I tRNA ligase family protein [Candidatus Binatia bacterium]
MTMAKLERSRNFANKLWNAARYVLGSQPTEPTEADQAGRGTGGDGTGPMSLAERWIRSRLAATTAEATRRMDRYDLGGYATSVTDFAWSDYCDWFLEMAKVELRDPEVTAETKARLWATAADVLAGILRLLHPVMPFVTEEIWAGLGAARPSAGFSPLLLTASWPSPGQRDRGAEAWFAALADVIRAARNLRTEGGLPAGTVLPLRLIPIDADAAEAATSGRRYVEPLARVRLELLDPEAAAGTNASAATAGRAATSLGAIWLEAAFEAPARSDSRVADLRRSQARLQALLADPDFVARAPAPVVERERQRLAEIDERLRQIGEASGSG